MEKLLFSNAMNRASEGDVTKLSVEERITMILENEVQLKEAQKPLKLLPVEEMTVRSILNHREYIKNTKVHCTACNKHMGSACVDQFDRYIHPILNTIICKKCYDFYYRGDFEKDVDGSEIFCKWCGEGGTVICCSSCCFVFCEPCIKRNLGPERVKEIKCASNWSCYRCKPEQLSKFHILSHILYQFVNRYTSIAREKGNTTLLKMDLTTCCVRSQRRKTWKDSDEEFTPDSPKLRKRKRPQLQIAKLPNAMNPIIQIPDRSRISSTTSSPAAHSSVTNAIASTKSPIFGKQLLPKIRNHPIGSANDVRTQRTSNTNPQSQFLREHQLMPRMYVRKAPILTQMPRLKSTPSTSVAEAPQSNLEHKMDWIRKATYKTRITCRLLVRQMQALEALVETKTDLRNITEIHNTAASNLIDGISTLQNICPAMNEDYVAFLKSTDPPRPETKQVNGSIDNNNAVNNQSDNVNKKKVITKYVKANGIPKRATKMPNLVVIAKPSSSSVIDLCDDDEKMVDEGDSCEYDVAASMCDAVLEETAEQQLMEPAKEKADEWTAHVSEDSNSNNDDDSIAVSSVYDSTDSSLEESPVRTRKRLKRSEAKGKKVAVNVKTSPRLVAERSRSASPHVAETAEQQITASPACDVIIIDDDSPDTMPVLSAEDAKGAETNINAECAPLQSSTELNVSTISVSPPLSHPQPIAIDIDDVSRKVNDEFVQTVDSDCIMRETLGDSGISPPHSTAAIEKDFDSLESHEKVVESVESDDNILSSITNRESPLLLHTSPVIQDDVLQNLQIIADKEKIIESDAVNIHGKEVASCESPPFVQNLSIESDKESKNASRVSPVEQEEVLCCDEEPECGESDKIDVEKIRSRLRNRVSSLVHNVPSESDKEKSKNASPRLSPVEKEEVICCDEENDCGESDKSDVEKMRTRLRNRTSSLVHNVPNESDKEKSKNASPRLSPVEQGEVQRCSEDNECEKPEIDVANMRARLRNRLSMPEKIESKSNRPAKKIIVKAQERVPLRSMPSALSLEAPAKRSSMRVALRASLGSGYCSSSTERVPTNWRDKLKYTRANNAKDAKAEKKTTTAPKRGSSTKENDGINTPAKTNRPRSLSPVDGPPTLMPEVDVEHNALDLEQKEDLYEFAALVKELSWMQACIHAARTHQDESTHRNEQVPPVLTRETPTTSEEQSADNQQPETSNICTAVQTTNLVDYCLMHCEQIPECDAIDGDMVPSDV